MNRKLINLSLIVLFQIAISGCKSTDDKIQEFVMDYNREALNIKNDMIRSTSAQILPNHKIKLNFVSNLEDDEINKEVYDGMVPLLITGMFQKLSATSDLIEDGVVFEIVFLTKDKAEISKVTIDKKKLDELLNEKYKPGNGKTSKNEFETNENLSPELKEILIILNKSLPIEDKEAGTKIIKIDINDRNELVYTAEVNQELKELLKKEDSKNIMKDEILRNPDLKKILNGVKRLGVGNIVYKYIDGRGKLLTAITITEQDLL